MFYICRMSQQTIKDLELKKDNRTVVQHNAITTARYSMTATEKKIIYYMLYMVKDNKNLKNLQIPVSELIDNFKSKEINYKHLREATKKLIGRVYEIGRRGGDLLQVSIISSAEYKTGTGLIEISFDDKMKPYLLELKSNFTIFKLNQALSLRSIYSQRLYEILSSFADTGWWQITVDELREILKLKKKYSDYNMFKKKVILKAKEELEKYTEIRFTVQEMKTGKRVTSLRFTITTPDSEQLTIPFLGEEMERLTKKFMLSSVQAQAVIRNVPIKDINQTLYNIQVMKVNGAIDNIGSYTWSVFKSKFSI